MAVTKSWVKWGYDGRGPERDDVIAYAAKSLHPRPGPAAPRPVERTSLARCDASRPTGTGRRGRWVPPHPPSTRGSRAGLPAARRSVSPAQRPPCGRVRSGGLGHRQGQPVFTQERGSPGSSAGWAAARVIFGLAGTVPSLSWMASRAGPNGRDCILRNVSRKASSRPAPSPTRERILARQRLTAFRAGSAGEPRVRLP